MKLFISFHRADIEYKRRIETILRNNDIDYYAVPDNADFNGKNHQTIAHYLTNRVKKCDIILCLVGTDTYSRPHVDWEIHTALKGDINHRKGIIAVIIENRNDSKNHIDFNTFPVKLSENMNYIVVEQFSAIKNKIRNCIKIADTNRRNPQLQTTHRNPTMPLKDGKYYDN